MTAPVCHVAPIPPQSDQDGNLIPTIPPATKDPDSLLRTVNLLAHAMNLLSGRKNKGNNTTDSSNFPPPGNGFNGFSTVDHKKIQWIEQARAVEKVRIFQNDDRTSDNWVDVERINKLMMRDKTTGQVWAWDRKRK